MLKSLGYIGLNSTRIDDWSDWGENFLGLQLVDRTKSRLSFRMDDRKQRVWVEDEGEGPEGNPILGWEVADAAALDALGGRLESAGIRFGRLSAAECAKREVGDAIAARDPAGTRLEFFHTPIVASDPFVPGRRISGFRTGPLGVGHAVIYVSRIEDVLWFYQDVLGFRLSDYQARPTRIMFFHINQRHHSLALVEAPRNGLNHLMMELLSLDDVGQAYDIARVEEGRIGMSLGRHTNDFMTSFYAYGPSRFMVEYGWGGRTIDPDIWESSELTMGSSLWGHDLMWLDGRQFDEMRKIRRAAGEAGLRAAVQVIPGNFKISQGECPWFDRIRSRSDSETF
ncbi:biphenyl 2,3-dioxygenase [bacterium]|nr:biphenyl 2,3-dioxygenase [bacterium]